MVAVPEHAATAATSVRRIVDRNDMVVLEQE
jgi:hypothetical protein